MLPALMYSLACLVCWSWAQPTVRDPLQKWTKGERDAVLRFKSQWKRSRQPQDDGGNGAATRGIGSLTVAQRAWLYSLGDAKPGATVTSPTADRRVVRKELRMLTRTELSNFVRAVTAMKRTFPDPRDPRSEYDIFFELHQFESAPNAHNGAAFFPWHREFLWRFECALQHHVPGVAIPYWDSSLDQTLPQPRDSIVWTHLLLGNADGTVLTGPFSLWSALPSCHSFGRQLTRNWRLCPNPSTFLFAERDVAYVFNKTSYREIVPNFDSKFEDDHGANHLCVGGHMGSLACAPTDPAFYLLHSFVDQVWETFRQFVQRTKIEDDYPSTADGDIGGSGHERYQTMNPFQPLLNMHGMSDHYTRYYYRFEERPRLCRRQTDCRSQYLWCDTTIARCVSKIKFGGACDGKPDVACYGDRARCLSNKCGGVSAGSWWTWL